MSKQSPILKSTSSRRDFIKKKILGGVLFATGLPFLNISNLFRSDSYTPNYEKVVEINDKVDWKEIRQQFLLSNDICNLNTASHGASPKQVVERMYDRLKHFEYYSTEGRNNFPRVRKKVGTFLNAKPEEIAFTRNATEGMNIVAKSLSLKQGDEVVMTKHEHIGGAAPWIALQKEIGIKIKLIDLDLEGRNNLQIIKESLTEKTKVLMFSHITCTTGLRLPVKEIVELCRDRQILSCVDGAQAIGMIPIDLADLNPDFYVCSGHKWLLGPKGTGVLFVKESIIEKCKPVFVGSFSDSKFDLNSLTFEHRTVIEREEYGTRNTPMLQGMESAIEFISTIGIENIVTRSRELISHFRMRIAQMPEIEILTPEDLNSSASIVTIRLKGKDNLAIGKRLREEKNIRVRGIYENDLNGLRISFAIYNNQKEIDFLVDNLKEIAAE